MKVARIDELETVPIVDGTISWRPIRRTLGIEAFGVNAYTADAGHDIVEEHDETGSGAGGHEELYVVVSGHAVFTVDGKEVDAPAGTLVFLDDPAERRAARATEDGTTVLAIGGARGKAFSVSPWEYYMYGTGVLERDPEAARKSLEEGIERFPQHGGMAYNYACVLALTGARDAALEQLERGLALRPQLADLARTDSDLDTLRDDPRFPA